MDKITSWTSSPSPTSWAASSPSWAGRERSLPSGPRTSLRSRRLALPWVPVFIGTGLALMYAFLYRPDFVPSGEWLATRHTAFALAWILIFAAIMLPSSGLLARGVDNWLAVRLSVIAYAVYLVHEPLLLAYEATPFWTTDPTMLIGNTIIVVLLTLPVAWLVHRLIEEPWTDLGALQDRRGGRKELYPHLLKTYEVPAPPPTSRLREAFLAAVVKNERPSS